MTRADAARRRNEDRLLGYPNVTGVGTSRDPRTGAETIDVYVTRRVPPGDLRPQDVVPHEIEGVPVRVVEIGEIEAQGMP
jgi:hypothetical protein